MSKIIKLSEMEHRESVAVLTLIIIYFIVYLILPFICGYILTLTIVYPFISSILPPNTADPLMRTFMFIALGFLVSNIILLALIKIHEPSIKIPLTTTSNKGDFFCLTCGAELNQKEPETHRVDASITQKETDV